MEIGDDRIRGRSAAARNADDRALAITAKLLQEYSGLSPTVLFTRRTALECHEEPVPHDGEGRMIRVLYFGRNGSQF